MHRTHIPLVIAAFALAACSDSPQPVAPHALSATPVLDRGEDEGASHLASFTPINGSAVCTVSGGDPVNPLVTPAGFTQTVIASEPSYITNGDMQTLNETGPQNGRFLYRTHEVGANAGISVTDLHTLQTAMVIQRADWEGLDGIVWTPWGTILFAEEAGTQGIADPDFPAATAGLVYELDPNTRKVVARPALGARAHEGQVFDAQGNYYGISERAGGAIFKFVPDRKGDLSKGQLYALKLTTNLGDNTGPAIWVALDRNAVRINSDAEATANLATGYGRPEDLEISEGRGNRRQVIYAALTNEARIIAIELESASSATVRTYVKAGVNAPADFSFPDNLVLDRAGNLFVTEDPGGSFGGGKRTGDDIWVASPPGNGSGQASAFRKFASINDCDAEPTGITFDKGEARLFVDIQHRGGDGLDKTVAIARVRGHDDH